MLNSNKSEREKERERLTFTFSFLPVARLELFFNQWKHHGEHKILMLDDSTEKSQ